MGKKDRYNVEGAEDTLGEDKQQSAASEARSSNEEETTSAVSAAGTAKTDTSVGNKSIQDTEPEPTTNSKPATQNNIPHRVRYDSPKENRDGKTFYLDSEHDLARIRELQSLAESEFEEKVHQLDVYLATFRSNLSDESFLEEMRQIGYGYFE